MKGGAAPKEEALAKAEEPVGEEPTSWPVEEPSQPSQPSPAQPAQFRTPGSELPAQSWLCWLGWLRWLGWPGWLISGLFQLPLEPLQWPAAVGI